MKKHIEKQKQSITKQQAYQIVESVATLYAMGQGLTFSEIASRYNIPFETVVHIFRRPEIIMLFDQLAKLRSRWMLWNIGLDRMRQVLLSGHDRDAVQAFQTLVDFVSDSSRSKKAEVQINLSFYDKVLQAAQTVDVESKS
ncbi:MAG: hypothetical protein QW838_02790 [Candidatus Nitrosotenuis sp.]